MRSFIESQYKNKADVLSVLAIEKQKSSFAIMDGFDVLVIVVSNKNEEIRCTHHYSKDSLDIQERWYDWNSLAQLASYGENRDVRHWLMVGDIVLDTDDFLLNMKGNLSEMSPEKRQLQQLTEFAHFLRHYSLSKNYLEDGDVLDAHSHILAAVHYWARLSVVEQGFVPELTVWKQVRRLNPGIFKLFEELTTSEESLEQRIKLAYLACDFSVMSKLAKCCEPLIRVISSRVEPWSVAELENHPELNGLQAELHLLLKKLTYKSLIKEVFVPSDDQLDMLEIRYSN